MTIAEVLTAMTTVYGVIIGMFSNVITTITGNPLLYVPVLFGLFGTIVIFVIGFVKKLGVRGISSTGKRRRRGR